MQRRTGKLPVRQGDVVLFHRLLQHLQMIRTDLVAESPRSAVDHHTDLPFPHAKDLCCLWICDLINRLNLKEVIAGTKRSALRYSPRPGFFTDKLKLCPRHCAVLFTPADIILHSISHIHRICRTVCKYVGEIILTEPHRTFRSDSGRHRCKQILNKFFHIGNV